MDSNPHAMDSNLDSRKLARTTWIGIPIKWIRISIKEKEKAKFLWNLDSSCEIIKEFWKISERGRSAFEFPSQRFKSQDLELWRTLEDLNPRKKDSNPIYKMKLKAKGFKSSSYGFESLLGTQFKFCKGDSNLRNMDLNPSFCKSIKCLIRTAIYFKIQKISLSQWLVNALNGH